MLLHCTHSNLKARLFEIRLDRHMTIETIKEKLRSHTGTGSLFMHLTLLDHNDQVVADMINDELKLGYYSPMNGWTIHITDLDPHSLSANGGLEDVSLVKKYEISEEDYVKREDNFRKWKQDKKAADPTWSLAKEVKMNQDKKRMQQDPNFVPEPFEVKAPITDDGENQQAANAAANAQRAGGAGDALPSLPPSPPSSRATPAIHKTHLLPSLSLSLSLSLQSTWQQRRLQ